MATIDMSNNELDDQNLYYYPTIRFYTTNRKQRPLEYDQSLQMEDVVKFIKKFATVPLVEDYQELMAKEGTISGGVKEESKRAEESQQKYEERPTIRSDEL